MNIARQKEIDGKAVQPITIIGGGMITHDQILPSIYHLQRLGRVGKIAVSARRRATIKGLRNNAALTAAFPDSTFTPYPATSARVRIRGTMIPAAPASSRRATR